LCATAQRTALCRAMCAVLCAALRWMWLARACPPGGAPCLVRHGPAHCAVPRHGRCAVRCTALDVASKGMPSKWGTAPCGPHPAHCAVPCHGRCAVLCCAERRTALRCAPADGGQVLVRPALGPEAALPRTAHAAAALGVRPVGAGAGVSARTGLADGHAAGADGQLV